MQNRNLRKAFDMYSKSACNSAETKIESAIWSAWGSGAVAVAQRLAAVPGYELAPDSLDKARQLASLLIQPMITMWLVNFEKQQPRSGNEMAETRRNEYQWILAFLSIPSAQLVAIHVILDEALTRVLHGQTNSPAPYLEPFYQRYRECVTGEQIVDWTKLKIPMDPDDFLAHCDKSTYKLPALDYIGWAASSFAAITDAGAHMFQEFRRIHNPATP